MSRLYPPPAIETLKETLARWERERPAIRAAAQAALAAARLAVETGADDDELDDEVDEYDRFHGPVGSTRRETWERGW